MCQLEICMTFLHVFFHFSHLNNVQSRQQVSVYYLSDKQRLKKVK